MVEVEVSHNFRPESAAPIPCLPCFKPLDTALVWQFDGVPKNSVESKFVFAALLRMQEITANTSWFGRG